MGVDCATCHVECACCAIHDEEERENTMVERKNWEVGASHSTTGEKRQVLESTLPSSTNKQKEEKEGKEEGAAGCNVPEHPGGIGVGPSSGH